MFTLSELIGRQITPEAKERNSPKCTPLSAPIVGKSEKPHDRHEAEVFNFLFAKEEGFGIRSGMRFAALLVDGAVELEDGRRLAVEIKLRMNWVKACQAEWQYRTFLKRKERQPFPVVGAVV